MNSKIQTNTSTLYSPESLSYGSNESIQPNLISLDDLPDEASQLEESNFSHVDTLSDALILSLSNKGEVDIGYISKISGIKKEEIISKLRGVIFLNPQKYNGDIFQGYETKEKYLSGNLYLKLKEAKVSNETFKGLFDINIVALNNEISTFKKVEAKDIYVTIGTPWLGNDVIEKFTLEIFGVKTSVAHDHRTGSWSVHCLNNHYNVYTTSKYGTKKMNALEILSKTLNQIPIVVNKPKLRKDDKTVRDEDETLFALEKQKAMLDCFTKWIKNSPNRCKYLELMYNSRYGYNSVRKFDGSYLQFPDMNKEIKLYDYQKNAIARMMFTPNTLLSHDVGSGKTFEMIAAAYEMKRIGLAKKTMIVVPNNIVTQWKQMFKLLYPLSNVLIVEPKTFNPHKRKDVLNDIIYNDYDAIVIAYSCFEMIDLSPDELKIKYEKERDDIRASFCDSKKLTSTVKRNFTALVNGKFDSQVEKLGTREPGKIYFDDLGIDHLFVDEAHNFKNVPIKTNTHVLGINTSGSKNCEMMMEKVHYIQRKHNGGGVVFATGTPITNSISDVYTIQRYLQEGELTTLNIDCFNSWISNFAELSQQFEIDVDTSSYRMASRYSKFHNLPELSALLANIADFHHIDNDDELPKFNGYQDVLVEETADFNKFIECISKRADLIRKHNPVEFKSKTGDGSIKDNMLLVTRDGRDGALDLRLVYSDASFKKESKVFKCAEEVSKIYFATMNDKLTQLIFCDTSTPNNHNFNIYDELRRLLEQNGINSSEIAYIHDADTEAKRKTLFNKVNSGEIRILIGSTFKLGLGVNVQKKLVAVHHIDVPWRPSDMVQREGRIIRPGNENEEVFIYRYISKHSFDAYSWQLLETKQSFISKLLSNKVNERQASDIDDTVLNYGEVKALAIGNPLIKERVETYNEINRLVSLQQKQAEHLFELKAFISMVEDTKSVWLDEINKVKEDLDYVKNNIHISSISQMEENLNKYSRQANIDERKNLKEFIYSSVVDNATAPEEKEITTYCGFKVFAPAYSGIYEDKFVYLKRTHQYKVKIGTNSVGVITRLNNFLKGFENHYQYLCDEYKRNLENCKNSKIELTKVVDYESLIAKLQFKLSNLDSKLEMKEE